MMNHASERSRLLLWIALLVFLGAGFSLGFACATPFAAFAAAGALTLPRRAAWGLIGAAWVVNQLVGYTILDYPHAANTYIWGIVMGIAALLATLAAQVVSARLNSAAPFKRSIAAFLAAFAAYQATIALGTLTPLGGSEHLNLAEFITSITMNALALAGLLGLHWLNNKKQWLPLPAASSERETQTAS